MQAIKSLFGQSVTVVGCLESLALLVKRRQRKGHSLVSEVRLAVMNFQKLKQKKKKLLHSKLEPSFHV